MLQHNPGAAELTSTQRRVLRAGQYGAAQIDRLLSAVSYSAHFDAGLDKDKSGLALCDVTATAAVTFH